MLLSSYRLWSSGLVVGKRTFGYGPSNPFPVDKLVADFRSDTLTRISPGMKEAMFSDDNYGDDVYGEDMIINELETKVAKLCNKEKALFCVSGTMTNQLGLRAQLQPLQSLLCDHRAHIYEYEAGGVAYHSQAQCRPILPANGTKTINFQDVAANIFKDDVHRAVTAGVSLENTLWGSVIELKDIWKIKDVCKEHDLFLHLDGARLPNACVKAGLSLAEYAEPFDTVSMCLSKSLGCPVGSVLVGNAGIIQKAKHFRKLFGGGWRQAGMLASASIYALDNHWDRLAEDHDNAALLTKELMELGLEMEFPTETNQVWANSEKLGITFDTFSDACRKEGIIVPTGEYSCRLVTHLQTSRSSCEQLLQLFNDVIKKSKQ